MLHKHKYVFCHLQPAHIGHTTPINRIIPGIIIQIFIHIIISAIEFWIISSERSASFNSTCSKVVFSLSIRAFNSANVFLLILFR